MKLIYRMACNIEDAGFEIRDMIAWVYGCLSEDTEILTINGWKKYNKVKKGDFIFACEWEYEDNLVVEEVKEIYLYDYDEDAYYIKDTGYYESDKLKQTDHIVSKNHNVIVSGSSAILPTTIMDRNKKVKAEKLYELVQNKIKNGGNQSFSIPGLNGDIPCTIEKKHYRGKVWCVEVGAGAFVARRNGKIFITGNSGFPKSHNIGKAVDKKLGNDREVVGRNPNSRENFIFKSEVEKCTCQYKELLKYFPKTAIKHNKNCNEKKK